MALDQDDGRRIGELLRVPYHAVVRHIAQAMIEAGYGELRPAHMSIFQHLDHPPGGTQITVLADRAQMTKQSMGELVDYLVKLGYVERIPDPTDRRAKLVRFTELGWELHEVAPRIGMQLEEQWKSQLGEEKLNQLRRLLKELIATLET